MTNLSPAAQAVLNVIPDVVMHRESVAFGVINTVANQMKPVEEYKTDEAKLTAMCIRLEMLSIAIELGRHND